MLLLASLNLLNFYVFCSCSITIIQGAPFEWNQYSVRSGQIGPIGRKFHAFGFDLYRQFLVVFGGIGANGTVLSDTWVLDVAAGMRAVCRHSDF